MKHARGTGVLATLLCLALWAPAWASLLCVPAARPAMRGDMAACCPQMLQHCPDTPADSSCCQQHVAAYEPAALPALAAPVLPALSATRHLPAAPVRASFHTATAVTGAAPTSPPLATLRI